MIKREYLINFFVAWTVFEFVVAAVLLLILPKTIKINFGFILTNQASSGSKFNVLALPVTMLLASAALRYCSKYFNKTLDFVLILANIVVLLGTSFFLGQLFVMK
ncbi:hypothetical protein OfM1_09560 [Lactovum odontotermitis]